MTEPDIQLKGKHIAYKHDDGKIRMELLPPESLFAIAKVLTHGASKYPDRNWEYGMSWSRVFGATMRHLWAWWGGAGPTSQNFMLGGIDNESKMSHLWHAGACIMMLIAYEDRAMNAHDDRPNVKEMIGN